MESQQPTSANRSDFQPDSDPVLDFKLAVKEGFQILARQKRLFGFLAVFSIGLAITDYVFFPSHTVSAHLFFESQNANSGLRSLLGSLEMLGKDLGDDEVEDQKFLLSLDSADFERRLDSALQADPEFPKHKDYIRQPLNLVKFLRTFFRGTVMGWFRTSVPRKEIYGVKPTHLMFLKKGILEVRVTSSRPDTAAFLINHYLETAVKMFSEREGLKIEGAKKYIQAKIEETLSKMDLTDRKILSISSKNASLSLLAPQSSIAERLLEMRSQIQRNELNYDQNVKVIQSLKEKNQTECGGPDAQGVNSVSCMFGVGKTITKLTADNEMIKLKIQTLKAGLQDVLKHNLSLPKDEQSLADLKREKGLDFYIFDNLIKTLLQVEVKGLTLLNRVYPLEKVGIDRVHVSRPLGQEILLCLLVFFVIGASLIYGLDYINPAIRSKKDFDSMRISHLGDIPEIDSQYFADVNNPLRICRFNIESKETIAFKHVRSRLAYLAEHSGSTKRKVIAMMSYGNNEGKSFISSNVATCFSQMGVKTLLIDFDLRRGALTKQFSLSSRPGMCAYLDGLQSLEETVVKNILPNLDFIPAGQWNSATTEHFSNEALKIILDKVKAQYDYIIIDTAPLVVAHESLAIAQDADFAVLLATAWKTRKEYMVDAIAEIKNVRSGRIHVLLNRTKQIDDSLVSNYYYMKRSSGLSKLIHQST